MKSVLICMLQLHKNSGSARTAFENIRYFKDRGYEVHVAAMTMDTDSISSMGVVPHKLFPWIKGTGVWRRKWYDWQVRQLRKKLSPTIVLGHGDIQEQDVVTLHNCVFLASELIHGRPLANDHEMAKTHGRLLQAQLFKKLIANSQLMKLDLIKRFKIPSEKIHVMYPALDVATFYPRPELKNELRQRFQFSEKVIVSLVTSGNFKKRGLDIFKEAIHLLPQEIKDKADFRVVGKEEKGSNSNQLLTFDPPINDIENYYNAIDIFVLPARIEEFGRVVLEAMGCGLPVITTDKVGAGELLASESKEFVLPSLDVDALRRAMERLISDPQLRERLGKLNFELAQNESEDRLYQKFDQIFLEI